LPPAATPPATIGVGSSGVATDNSAGAASTGEDPLAVGTVTNGNPSPSGANAPNAGNALPQTPDALVAATAGSTQGADAAAARLAGTVAAAGRATDTSPNGVHGSAGQGTMAGLTQNSQSDPQFVAPQAAGADTSNGSLGLSNFALFTSPTGGDVSNNSDGIANQTLTAPTDGSANASSVIAAPITTAAAAPTHAADSTNALVPISEVAVTIAARAQSGSSNFEIRLDPPDLGRIDVQLKVDSGGNVTSHIIAERPETLNLLQRQAPQLERALQDAGLNTGEGMQFSLADQGFAGNNAYTTPDFDSGTSTAIPTSDSVPAIAAQGYSSWSGRSGGLDITV
jgi:flagellar hook-length control protein FliK